MTFDVAPRVLHWRAAHDVPELIAPEVASFIATWDDTSGVRAAAIDPELADTAEFCRTYGVAMDDSANCVVVAGKRAGVVRYAACVVLASMRADVNSTVRRLLDVRKASFAPMQDTVALTGMEYGGITPLGLPSDWRIFVAPEVAAASAVVIGSGIRRSKLKVPGELLARLPCAEVVEGLAKVVQEVSDGPGVE
jgi:prolyl-tRNA editing enzyme YbaK/EbsC (Cys-tRNA(Pro) deacylase)